MLVSYHMWKDLCHSHAQHQVIYNSFKFPQHKMLPLETNCCCLESQFNVMCYQEENSHTRRKQTVLAR